MTEDIIEMARQAGFETMLRKGKILGFDRDGDYTEELEAFAKLVAAKEREEFAVHAVDIARRAIAEEREACAKVCESHKSENFPLVHNNAVVGCAFAIRARGVQ